MRGRPKIENDDERGRRINYYISKEDYKKLIEIKRKEKRYNLSELMRDILKQFLDNKFST